MANWLRKFGTSFAAAMITGVILGFMLRGVMRFIAMANPELSSGFHWEATLLIALIGVAFTLANSVIYTVVERLLPRRRAVKGFVYGFINLVVYGIPFLLSNPGGELFGPQVYVGVLLFSLVFVIGGVMLAWFVDLVERWVDNNRIKRLKFAYASFICLCLPACIAFIGILFEMVTKIIPEIGNQWF